MPQLWNVLAETTVQPEDSPSGDTAGYMNIITWASSSEEATTKIAAYLGRFDWHIVEIEEVKALDLDFHYDGEEFQDMVERARSKPQAILCGTFHSYKVN